MYIPEPKKQPSGNYFVRLRLDGVSYPITASSARECKHQAEVLKAQYRAGKRLETKARENPTLRTAIDSYIAKRSNTLSPATIRGYRIIQNNRFISVMDMPMKSVKSWQKVVNEEATRLSPKSLKNTWFFVASVLRENGLDVPAVNLPQVVQNEHPFLQPEQIAPFIQAVKGEKCEVAALLGLSSLRRSEMCALKWENVDLKNKRILVSGSAVYNADNKLEQKATNKNTSSRRYVPIIIPELQAALERIEVKEGLVIRQAPNTVYRQVNAICEANDFPLIGVHGLRHSFASLAYHLNVPEKVAMQIGGWSDYNTMRKIYTHIAESDIDKYTNDFKQFFNNANENGNYNSQPA